MDGAVLSADVVVVALGPWSAHARAWLPQLPAMDTPTKYHSTVLRPSEGTALKVGAHCLFTSLRLAGGRCVVAGCGACTGYVCMGGSVGCLSMLPRLPPLSMIRRAAPIQPTLRGNALRCTPASPGLTRPPIGLARDLNPSHV